MYQDFRMPGPDIITYMISITRVLKNLKIIFMILLKMILPEPKKKEEKNDLI